MWLLVTKSVALGAAGLLLMVAIASRRIVGSWINAASIFSLFWFAYTAFPLVIAWEVPINVVAVFYIVLFNFLFASSVIFFNWRAALLANGSKVSARDAFGSRFLVATVFLLSLLSILCILQGMRLQGIELSSGNVIEFASNYAALRYAEELEDSVYSKLGVLLNFLVIVMGGFAWGGARGGKFRAAILCASFAPAALTMITQSAKGPFLLALALFAGTILVTRVYDKKYYLINRKSACTLAIWGVGSFALVMISFLSRGIDVQGNIESISKSLWSYFVTYSSGHLYAFGDWFSGKYFDYSLMSYNDDDSPPAFYSFMSLFRILGIDRPVPLGVYGEFYDYDGVVITNVYTVFRGLLTDFSLVGSLLVGWLAGLCCNWFCFGLYVVRNSAFFAVAFVYFFGMSYQSFVVSSLTWMSVPVSFVILVVWFAIYFTVRKTGVAARAPAATRIA